MKEPGRIVLATGSGSTHEKIQIAKGVPADAEFNRIDSLPRRVWTNRQRDVARKKLTARLQKRNGKRELWEDQAVALAEIGWYGGTVCGIRVSGGKTTISFLAGTVLEDLPRPLLIAPSKSIKAGKVAAAYREERKYWRVRDDYAWISYHDLQSEGYANYLEQYRPGILILDEAHHVGRYNSARTSRVAQYVKSHPKCAVIVLTGSVIASRVVDDSLNLCYWARREHSPLPLPSAKQCQRFWKLALDIPQRCGPGALRKWAKPNETTINAVGRRYTSTPGVVCSAGENVIGTSLAAHTELVRLVEPKTLAAFDHIRNGRRPDGTELLDTDGANTWLTAQTLALGFYYVYDPEPPSDWLDAYRNWCAYCREHIASSDCVCDTEKRVKQHIDLDGAECWPLDDWRLVQHKYRLHRKAIWLDKTRVEAAAKWMVHHKHGLVWVQFRAFGQALSLVSKRPFYSGNAFAHREKRYITAHAKTDGPAIASIKACSEDLNLQHTFHQNLIPAPPATGAWDEQLLARTHRFGCDWPEVTATFWLACAENKKNMAVAVEREKRAAAMTGDGSRKLLIADWTHDKLPALEGPQWTKVKIAKKAMK